MLPESPVYSVHNIFQIKLSLGPFQKATFPSSQSLNRGDSGLIAAKGKEIRILKISDLIPIDVKRTVDVPSQICHKK